MALNLETLAGELDSVSLAIDGGFTTNAAGSAVNITDYKGKLLVVLNAAAAANDNQSLTVKLQTSIDDNASNFVDFDPAVTFTPIAADGAAQVQEIELDTRIAKGFVRTVSNENAAGNGRAFSVVAVGKKVTTS
jgi:hypothetical protein